VTKSRGAIDCLILLISRNNQVFKTTQRCLATPVAWCNRFIFVNEPEYQVFKTTRQSRPVAVILAIITASALFSCMNRNHQVRENLSFSKRDNYSFRKIDSISFQTGNFLNYLFVNDSMYMLKWGNKNQFSISLDTFKIKGDGKLEIDANNQNSILLKQSCGSFCQSAVILTIPSFYEKKYLFVIAYDLKNNLVAYFPENDKAFIIVENYLTSKKQSIEITDLCPAVFKGECIDSISLIDKQLYIKWQGSNWSRKQKDTREIRIKM
jgi:hypothetical protein